MTGSVLILGPNRPVHEVFQPLWRELEFEQQRFNSTDAAIEVIHSGTLPNAIVVSYPLWDSSLEDLLTVIGRSLPSERSIPLVVLAPEASLAEVSPFEERGITILSEDREPDDLCESLRSLLRRGQRAHPRFIVRMAVQVEAAAVLRACQSENISLSGMLIRTSEDFPVGSQVELEFALQDDDEPIQCQAEVVRFTQPGSESIHGMGVRFLSFADDGLERLKAFLGD